jgi:ABC-type uncharacterized transport system substrate-binding protein
MATSSAIERPRPAPKPRRGLSFDGCPIAGSADSLPSWDRTAELRNGSVLVLATTPFLNVRLVQLAQRAAFHRVPAAHESREFVEVGGLMSYGSNLADTYRQAGVYIGRILKGAKPAELPVVQSANSSWSSTSRPPGCSV